MRLYIEAEAIEKAKRVLSEIPHGAEKASARALNRAILAVRTVGVKAVGKEYTIKSSKLKEHMTMKKAGYGQLSASLTVTGSPIDLTEFKVKSRKSGIFVQVKKTGGGTLKHSFFVTTGKRGIYHRTTQQRLPIQREYGPSVPQMIGNSTIIEIMEHRGQEVLNERMDHEINAMLERITK